MVASPLIVIPITDHQHEAGVTGAAAYAPSLMIMAGLLAVGFIANLLIRPVAEKHHLPAPDLDSGPTELPEPVRNEEVWTDASAAYGRRVGRWGQAARLARAET